MTNKTITLTVPNDDAIALHHLGEAMQRMADAHGFNAVIHPDDQKTIDELESRIKQMIEPCVGTTLTKGMSKDEMRDTLFAAQDAVKLPSLSGESLEQHIPAAELARQHGINLGSTVIEEPEPTIEERPDHDSDGTPWDERIHAESRALNADGTWRARRKPKDMEQAEWEQHVEDVKAELSSEEQLELPDTGDAEQPAPVAPPVVTPPPVTAPVGDLPTDFIGLLQWLTGNGFNSVVVDPVLKSRNLPNLTALKDTPEMIPQFAQAVADYARGVE